MTFQQLVAKLKLEASRQGPAPTSPETSSKDDLRLWGWVADEWEKLQSMGVMWRFLRETRSLTTVANQSAYNSTAMGGAYQRPWLSDSNYRARVIDGSSWYWMRAEMSYDDFRREFSPGHAPGQPIAYAQSPSGQMLLGPTPDRVISVEIDVVRSPAVMSHPADEPTGLPAQHQKLLVWGAMKRLAVDDAAGELLQRANNEYADAWDRLWSDQGPLISFGPRSL